MNCPFCAEEIKDTAQICKHCGRDFLIVRPLLDQVQGLAKRFDSLQREFEALGETVRRAHHRQSTEGGALPSMHRGSAIAFAVVTLFVAGFFTATVRKAGNDLRPEYLLSALLLLPFCFAFLCQNDKRKPLLSDVGAALVVTVLTLSGLQLVKAGLLDTSLWPRPSLSSLAPNSWGDVCLNAISIFLSFKAGTFLRYWVQSRQRHRRTQVTFATDVSMFLVSRTWSAHLSPTEIEPKIRSLESIIHSLSGICAGCGAVAAYLLAHFAGS